MATHVILPEYTLHRIPENLSSNEAILIEPLSVAVHCFRRLGNVKGENVGIVGAGTLGLMCVHAAKAMGAVAEEPEATEATVEVSVATLARLEARLAELEAKS